MLTANEAEKAANITLVHYQPGKFAACISQAPSRKCGLRDATVTAVNSLSGSTGRGAHNVKTFISATDIEALAVRRAEFTVDEDRSYGHRARGGRTARREACSARRYNCSVRRYSPGPRCKPTGRGLRKAEGMPARPP